VRPLVPPGAAAAAAVSNPVDAWFARCRARDTFVANLSSAAGSGAEVSLDTLFMRLQGLLARGKLVEARRACRDIVQREAEYSGPHARRVAKCFGISVPFDRDLRDAHQMSLWDGRFSKDGLFFLDRT
jgi:hypothetical protein